MSLSELMLDQHKPWAKLRINNLTVDGNVNNGNFPPQYVKDFDSMDEAGGVYFDGTNYDSRLGDKLITRIEDRAYVADPLRTYNVIANTTNDFDRTGGAYDALTGIYTVPEDGIYELDFDLAHSNDTDVSQFIGISMDVNNIQSLEPWRFMKEPAEVGLRIAYSGQYSDNFFEGQQVSFKILVNSTGNQAIRWSMNIRRVL